MRLVARWGAAVAVSAAGFALAWWVCQGLIGADEGVSLAIAGAVLAILLAVAAWWAPQGADSGGTSGGGPEQPPPAVDKTGNATTPSAEDRSGNVTNTISGGTQHGPVLQGRDFTGLTFGSSPAPPASPPEDPGAG